MTIRWPCLALVSQDIAFNIASRSLSGPASVSGVSQVVASDAGIWTARLGNIVILSRDHVLAFRALAALLDGRLGTILVPASRAFQPVPTEARGAYEAVVHDDGATFSDGSGYRNRVIDVVAAAAAPARATTMTVEVRVAGDIQPGHYFSIDERLYRVRSFDAASGALGFRPVLREAVAAGTPLEFDDPVCRMRLAGDAEMDLELAMRRTALPSVNFIEAL